MMDLLLGLVFGAVMFRIGYGWGKENGIIEEHRHMVRHQARQKKKGSS